MAPTNFIYQMVGVEKVLPNGRTILDKTWLSFYTTAKIGVIGHNGSGKSTLLRIMAGIDDAHNGETILKGGATVGLLPQEPQLDPTLDVRGCQRGFWRARRRLRQARRAPGRASGRHRRRGRLGDGSHPGHRDGRAARASR